MKLQDILESSYLVEDNAKVLHSDNDGEISVSKSGNKYTLTLKSPDGDDLVSKTFTTGLSIHNHSVFPAIFSDDTHDRYGFDAADIVRKKYPKYFQYMIKLVRKLNDPAVTLATTFNFSDDIPELKDIIPPEKKNVYY